MTAFEVIPWAVLLAGLAAAVRQDLMQHRIPNVACAVVLIGGLALHSSTTGLQGALFSLAGVAIGFIAFLPLHLMRGMGAGDVKLMAAVGSFLGPLGTALAAATTLVLGVFLAVGLICRRRLAQRPGDASVILNVGTGSVLQQRFPYAVAIAGGTLILMWQQGHWSQLAAAFME